MLAGTITHVNGHYFRKSFTDSKHDNKASELQEMFALIKECVLIQAYSLFIYIFFAGNLLFYAEIFMFYAKKIQISLLCGNKMVISGNKMVISGNKKRLYYHA